MRTLAKLDKPAALSHWQRLLNKSSPRRLKARPAYQLNFDDGPSFTSTIFEQVMRSIDHTFATVLKAAWAAVLAKFCAKQDAAFGTLINGRSEADAQEMCGPCINIIPVRMTIDKDWRVRDLLAAVNDQSIASMPFENLGLRTIIRECTQRPKWSYFGSVVRHNSLDSEQSDQHQRNMHDGELPEDSTVPDVDSAKVRVISAPRGKDISLSVGFATKVASNFVAHAIAEDLRSTIVRLYHDIDAPCLVNEQLPTTPPMPAMNSHHGSPQHATVKERVIDALDQGSSKLVAASDSAWRAIFGFDVDRERIVSESCFIFGGDLIDASALSAHLQVAGYSLPIEDAIRHPTFPSQVQSLSKVE